MTKIFKHQRNVAKSPKAADLPETGQDPQQCPHLPTPGPPPPSPWPQSAPSAPPSHLVPEGGG